MKHLRTEDVTVLREKLLHEGSALGQRIKRVRVGPQQRDGDAADITAFDRDADMLWVLEEQGCGRLLGIDEALRRMEQGTYGVCGTSASDIPLARLLAVPGARYCVACQEKADGEEEVRGREPVEEGLLAEY